jgi:hypothetical protein
MKPTRLTALVGDLSAGRPGRNAFLQAAAALKKQSESNGSAP